VENRDLGGERLGKLEKPEKEKSKRTKSPRGKREDAKKRISKNLGRDRSHKMHKAWGKEKWGGNCLNEGGKERSGSQIKPEEPHGSKEI